MVTEHRARRICSRSLDCLAVPMHGCGLTGEVIAGAAFGPPRRTLSPGVWEQLVHRWLLAPSSVTGAHVSTKSILLPRVVFSASDGVQAPVDPASSDGRLVTGCRERTLRRCVARGP